LNGNWTEERLAALPVQHGFRLRGLEMTRLETFCDAAFAFAVTLLVISGDGIPKSYAELIEALKGIPAFAASFAAIASFWWAHREWSRRFGLEDGITTTLSLAMVAVMMIYVYPLKMIFSAFAFWVSGGFFPTEFTLDEPVQLLGIFAIYGFGFAAWATLLALLHARALKVGDRLGLSDVERLRTWQEITMNGTLAATGDGSTAGPGTAAAVAAGPLGIFNYDPFAGGAPFTTTLQNLVASQDLVQATGQVSNSGGLTDPNNGLRIPLIFAVEPAMYTPVANWQAVVTFTASSP
jgi:hypothetical protein